MSSSVIKIPLFILFFALSFVNAQTNQQSRDGYLRQEGNTWILGTSQTERRVQLINGQLVMSSLKNKNTNQEYQDGPSAPSEIKFLLDGKNATGWNLVRAQSRVGSQGELELDVELESTAVAATKHYIVYPGSAVIREWLTLQSKSAKSIRLTHVSFLNTRVLSAMQDLQFNYMTGGGNYNASQMLKSEPMSASFTRTIESNGGTQPISYSGYLPLIFLHNPKSQQGVAIGWDYLGHWQFEIGPSGMGLELAGYDKSLSPGEQIETPKVFLATFSGGVDELGNQLLDWQYAYLWDFTNPDYFGKTRWAVDWPDPWVGEGGTPSADNWGRRLVLDLRYIDLLRETGTDILWDDAGWYDKWGSWTPPDWKRTADYLRKHDMNWVLWYPTFLATPESKVAQQHPDWLIPGQKVLEQSIPGTADWQSNLLEKSVKDWGDYQWRYDIAPAASGNDTDLLAADQNFRRVLQKFKTNHPKSGIDACHGGGRWISYDLARFAESGEYTDGGVGPYSAYYTSLLVSPDKLHNVVDFDHTYYVPSTDRTHFAMNPTWYRDPGDGPDVEAIRKDWELYHFFIAQGVVGRWSHIFRPQVKNDDPVWYFQRMNRDSSKGVILTKHAESSATYFVTSRLKTPGASKDRYRGGASDMNMVTTTSVATLTTGIYEDPVDGAPRYYGVPGQSFGPMNIKYQADGGEQSLVTQISRLGANRTVEQKFFGMELEPNQPITITQLGQFDPGVNFGRDPVSSNEGIYTLSLVRAEDGAVLASADLDMGKARTDVLGFKYVRLPQPVRLEPVSKPITIYPRGLNATQNYDVRTIHSSLNLRKTGTQLMSDGITLDKILAGELVFLNLSNYPGSGTDHTPPAAPSQITKRLGSNLGVQGIDLSWSAAVDNNWISYYEIRKNGKVIGKTAKGTYFFDHSDSSRGDSDATYEVSTVDGDGNHSPFVAAQRMAGDPQSFEALGDFGPMQAVKGWVYEETAGDGNYRELRWDKGGYEGRWTGSGLGRIGRIWMQPSATFDLSRTFIVPTAGTASTAGFIAKDPSAENQQSVFVKILHNEEQVWPSQGWAEIRPNYDTPTRYELSGIKVGKGDRLRFLIKHNDQNRADPILWNPKIVLQP